MAFRPLLAATLQDPSLLQYPVYMSPKLDGLRCLIQDQTALSRNMKPFRNKHVQMALRNLPTGMDGELIVGSPTSGNVLGRTQSGIMSADGVPDFTLHVFDNFAHPSPSFQDRFRALVKIKDHPLVEIVPHIVIHNPEQFRVTEVELIKLGYEGAMIRSMMGRYKQGRATHADNILWKFKRFKDAEAVVTGLEEGVTNENEQTRDAFGLAKRSHHQENMVGAGRVGTILAKDCLTGQDLRISPGNMTMDEKKLYWAFKERIIGFKITYKYFDYQILDQPRFATFKAFYTE